MRFRPPDAMRWRASSVPTMLDDQIRAVLLDLDGVLYQGGKALPGAADTVARLRTRGLTLRFVTNTATRATADILRLLASFGIDAAADELMSAPRAAHAWLAARRLSPYGLIHAELQPEFADLQQGPPDCVLIGDAHDLLDYAHLNQAFRLLMDGAPLVAIGLNRYYRGNDGLMLDAGGFVRALEWAAGVDAVIMGKPAADFYAQVVASTGYPAAQCLMIGDDVHADVNAAAAAGLRACLVRTGKFRPSDLDVLDPAATCIAHIGAL